MLRRTRQAQQGLRRAPAAMLASMFLVATLLVTTGSAPSAAQADPSADLADLGTQRGAVQQRQAAVAAELDVLHASSDQVAAALGDIDANVATQAVLTADAAAAADAARQAEADAVARVGAQQAEVDRIHTQLQGMAVNLYVRPPTEDLVHVVVNATPSNAPVSFTLARYRIESVTDLLDQAEQARDALVAAQQQAEAARLAAEGAAQQQAARLADLQAAKAQQEQFAGQLSDRIDHLLGEAAMLVEQEAELATQIQARELDLAARLQASMANSAVAIVVPTADPAPPPASDTTPATTGDQVTTPVAAPPAPDPGAATPGTDPPATAPPPPTAPPPTNPPTTTTTRPPRIVVITPVPTSWVRGIEVAAVIAPQTEAMLAAAERDGFILTGSGYRNILDQIEIRREVCGPTDYDIFEKPSWECSPPVAIPGRSNHEKGVAIDFSDNGDLIRTQDHPAFQWLAAHAAQYGFYNLPSEPWHWSIDGR